MTSRAWRAVIAVLLVGLVASVITDVGPSIIDADAERAVEIASLPCANSLQSKSSGYVLDNGLVITVAHAIYDSRDFAVRDATGRWHGATIQHLDLARDLALLRVPGLVAKPATFASARATDAIRLVEGAASGSVDGVVLRPVNITFDVLGSDESSSRRGYELETEIDPGDSGAAIVDQAGDLVAIVFARSTQNPGRAWATSSSEVRDVVNSAEVPDWDCGARLGAKLVLTQPERERLAG